MHPLIQIIEGETLENYIDSVNTILSNVRGSEFSHIHEYIDLFEQIISNIPTSSAQAVIGDNALGVSKQTGLPQIFYVY